MTPAEMRCVVGIDGAKQAHVVCALEAPTGVRRHQPSPIEATREGYAGGLRGRATREGYAGGLRALALMVGDVACPCPAASGPDWTGGDRGAPGAAR